MWFLLVARIPKGRDRVWRSSERGFVYISCDGKVVAALRCQHFDLRFLDMNASVESLAAATHAPPGDKAAVMINIRRALAVLRCQPEPGDRLTSSSVFRVLYVHSGPWRTLRAVSENLRHTRGYRTKGLSRTNIHDALLSALDPEVQTPTGWGYVGFSSCKSEFSCGVWEQTQVNLSSKIVFPFFASVCVLTRC